MKITAQDLKQLGIIDEIVPEPHGGAHADPAAAAELLAPSLERAAARAAEAQAAAAARRAVQEVPEDGRVRAVKVPRDVIHDLWTLLDLPPDNPRLPSRRATFARC